MQKILLLNKKEGETPLQALENLRVKNKNLKNTKMTYAGRLDPMASGLMIVLLGEEVKAKEKYLNFDKEYNFEILFGFATDTYDILGKVSDFYFGNISKENLEKEIKNNLKNFKGKIIQKYPKYSSKNIKSVLKGEEPGESNREVFIKKLNFIKTRKISKKNLLKNITKRINKVNGDFRQKEILKIWKNKLGTEKTPKHFFSATFVANVSSGTYIRTISNSLGEYIGIPALALYIDRVKVGKFKKLK